MDLHKLAHELGVVFKDGHLHPVRSLLSNGVHLTLLAGILGLVKNAKQAREAGEYEARCLGDNFPAAFLKFGQGIKE